MHWKKTTVFQADSPDPDQNFFPEALFFFWGGLRGKNGYELDAHLESNRGFFQKVQSAL